MWIWHFTKIIGVGYCVIFSELIVRVESLKDGDLCSVCACSEIEVRCKNLYDSKLLLRYQGPDVPLLTIAHSTLHLHRDYLKRFRNASSVTIASSDLGNNLFGIRSLTKVMNLNLYNCSLREIDSGIFSYNENLINLYLDNNKISSIENGAFNNLQRLSTLVLSSNSILQLPPDVFFGLSELEELDLSANTLTSVDIDIFKPLLSIKKINISANFLQGLGTDVFSDLVTLEELDVRGNRLRSLEAGAFAALRALKTLNLSDNLLEEVEADALKGLASLEELDLSGNRLPRVEASALAPLRSLRVLRLERNLLASFSPALVDLLAQRQGLSAQLEPNPLRCACGELRAAWAAATARGLILRLTCASGRPWNDVMRSLSCTDDGDSETVPGHHVEKRQTSAGTPASIPFVTERISNNSLLSETISNNSPVTELIFNNSVDESISKHFVTELSIPITVAKSSNLMNNATKAAIIPIENDELSLSSTFDESEEMFTLESVETVDEITLEILLVYLVCFVAIASTVAFVIFFILYCNMRKFFTSASAERNRLISTNSSSSECSSCGNVV